MICSLSFSCQTGTQKMAGIAYIARQKSEIVIMSKCMFEPQVMSGLTCATLTPSSDVTQIMEEVNLKIMGIKSSSEMTSRILKTVRNVSLR